MLAPRWAHAMLLPAQGRFLLRSQTFAAAGAQTRSFRLSDCRSTFGSECSCRDSRECISAGVLPSLAIFSHPDEYLSLMLNQYTSVVSPRRCWSLRSCHLHISTGLPLLLTPSLLTGGSQVTSCCRLYAAWLLRPSCHLQLATELIAKIVSLLCNQCRDVFQSSV
jgi:hypothetical protein